MNMLLSPELFILSACGRPSEREDVRADLGDNRPFSGLSLKSAWGIFKASVFGNYLMFCMHTRSSPYGALLGE